MIRFPEFVAGMIAGAAAFVFLAALLALVLGNRRR